MSPLSPFSPIETTDMREERYHGLRRLARVSRAFRETIVEELSSIAQTVEQVDNVNSYLDLYRIATRSKRLTRDSDAYTAYSPCIEPDSAYTACSFTSRRRSHSFSDVQRRSMHTLRSATPIARTSFIVPHSVTPSARTSFIVPHSATVCSEADRPSHYSILVDVPTPVRNAIVAEPRTAVSRRMSSMSYTLVLNVPPKPSASFPETPADEDSPLQQQQKAARARAAILAAMQPLQIPLNPELPQPDVSPVTPLPTSLPTSQAKTPRVPYWVRSSYRVSAHGYVRRTHSYSRRSGMRAPPTPRTIRRERRQGWGGQWTQGKIATVVQGLKEIQTPAPPVPPKDTVVVMEAL